LTKNLAAIIQKAIGNMEEVAVGILRESGIKVLQVRIVTDVDGSAGVEKIGEQQVGVEVLGRLSEVRFGLARTAAYWPMKRRESSRVNW